MSPGTFSTSTSTRLRSSSPGRTIARTSTPSASSSLTTFEPMNPAAPVTSAFRISRPSLVTAAPSAVSLWFRLGVKPFVDKLLAQLALEHLQGHGQRHRVDDADHARALVRRDVLLAPGEQLFLAH